MRPEGVSSAPSLLRAAPSGLKTSTSATSVAKQPAVVSSALISEANFAKLRNLSINIHEQQEAIKQKRERIDQIVNETGNFREEADANAKRVEISVLRQKYSTSLQAISNLTEARDDLTRRDEKRDEKAEEIESDNAESQSRIDYLEKSIMLTGKQVKIVGAELILRKRLMIRDLMDMFTISVDLKVNFKLKRPCTCFTLDMINNLHLPYTNCLTGHNEVETELVAAVGQVVHILHLLSVILDHPLRYPVSFESSRSCVVDNFTSERFILWKIRGRSDRENFEKGLTLIGKNVAQIRSDCGLPCAKPERILFNLMELLLFLAGRMKTVPKHTRPCMNVASPSSLLIVPRTIRNENAAIDATLNSLSEAIAPCSPVRWRENSDSEVNEGSGNVVLSPSKRNAFCYSSYSATSPQNSSPP